MTQNSKSKVIIFTECLSSTGLGHLGRCTALAEIFQEMDQNVEIVLHTDGTTLTEDSGIPIRVLNWKDSKILSDFLSVEDFQIAFVDSYLADINVYEAISKKTKKIICVDDTNRIQYPERAVILNPGLGGKYLDYDKDRYQILTGVEYILLRRPFRKEIFPTSVKEKINSILITVGGEDRWNIVPNILNVLRKKKHSWIKEVIIGPSFLNQEVIEQVDDRNIRMHSGLNAGQIKDLMLSVDFAITAGGQTTYELAYCGTPMVIVKLAENQNGNVQGFSELGVPAVSGYLSNENLFEQLVEILSEFELAEQRRIQREKFIRIFSYKSSVWQELIL
ncbi:PseG/SpsG family protein [Leptospira noguchii]|uniref:Glycosyltransferase family 1 domain protein n=1 Tax=Leptospira noguchii serovar Autumnalis str. ZUN142 TaxID=1085540 RepID=M6UDU7_9LEPT|nr:hypothetical protein [Leptospira noguchii]EMO43252.1 glycosyltransferase family 1 domain protein [Leptospira noguchii serovar Autumnalis str. ZUN142]EMS88661.1 glycosyltransferase family 1 domain protein [Leptospira noguchii str. Hook]UOG47559.1 UDP-2,4-diacetamido-2,4,6-trideoxy-beta-L-altropyranose hydrolase [Leptospira noguchii]